MASDGDPGEQPLRAARTNLFVTAALEWGGGSAPVTLRNLSATGVLIEGQTLPPPGTRVRVVRGSLSANGSAAWAGGRRCGLALDEAIDPALWMARPRNPRQAEIDRAVQRIKAGNSAVALLVAPTPTSDAVTTLRALEIQLAAISDDLAAAPATVARHAAQLQALVLIAHELARLRIAAESES